MQINRMFEIIYILIDKKTVTARELAERFEVSTRTIYRDIDTLSAAGIPVYMSKGKGGGISILSDYVLNKAVLTDEEKSDILSSLRAVSAINFNKTDTAVKKLGSLFGGGGEDWIEVDFSSWYHAEEEKKLFHSIKHSILAKKVISFSYASGKGESTVREVEPLKLCFKGMARYLYAYCLLRKDYRFFKLSRIRNLTVTDRHFNRTLSKPVFEADTMFDEQYVVLKLRISPEAAYRVYDEFEAYTLDADGSYIVELTYPRGKWIFSYISSFGQYCEVLEPKEIRDSIKAELEKTLQLYL